MKFLSFPETYSCFYWSIALFLSLFYGLQGILIKLHETHNENVDLKKYERKEWSLLERIIIQCSEYFLFNFVCSMAGFVALYVECKIILSINGFEGLTKIGSGTSVFLIFLSLIAILGISGKLSFIFFHGKIFGSKS